MTEKTRQELIAEATDLGLEFKGNISNAKLAELVADAQGPAVAPEYQDEPPAPPATNDVAASLAERAKTDPRLARRLKIKAAKDKAFETKIVTITNKDKRENEIMTTAFLSVENEFFGVSKVVPLDIPVELEVCLIKVAESTMMTLHKDEIKGGQRTGNKIAIPTKKYIVSYSNQTPD